MPDWEQIARFTSNEITQEEMKVLWSNQRNEIKKLKEENEKLKENTILKTYREEIGKIEKEFNEIEDIVDVLPFINKLKEENEELKKDKEEEEEEEEFSIWFDGGDETMDFYDKEEMKGYFVRLVKDMEEFGKIGIEAPIKKPYKIDCYGDEEVEDWSWGEDKE